MATAGLPFVTLKPLKSNNHIYKPCFIHPNIVHYNHVRSHYGFPYGSLSKTQNKPLVPHLRTNSSNRYASKDDDDDDDSFPRIITSSEYKILLLKWSAKQSLPVAITGFSFACALEGFFVGFCAQSAIALLVRIPDMTIEEVASQAGAYAPFFLSFMKSPWHWGRNYAVFNATHVAINYGINRLSGEKLFLIESLSGDKSLVQREMVAGFVAGVVMSLVIGFWNPFRMLPVATIYALLGGFKAIFLKFITGRRNPYCVTIDENDKGTESYLLIVAVYWLSKFHYLMSDLSSVFYFRLFRRFGPRY